jgi:hypothetical protein
MHCMPPTIVSNSLGNDFLTFRIPTKGDGDFDPLEGVRYPLISASPGGLAASWRAYP